MTAVMSSPASDSNAPKTQDERDLLLYEGRLNRPQKVKTPELERSGRLRHVIFSEQFNPALLDELGGVADVIRQLSKHRSGQDFLISLLHHKRAMLYFTQPSTRTFLSFMAACQILGITCNEVRDPQTSSETKGETRFDSLRMFSSYFDLIVMRSPMARLAESCAYLMTDLERSGNRSVPIVNAGSGADEHPTQALLDIYTLQRTFNFVGRNDSAYSSRFETLRATPGCENLTKGLANKTYAFCGDIGRGRTVRSLATLLANYENVRLVFISPDHASLRMRDDMRDRLSARGAQFYEFDSLEQTLDGKPIIESLDALYMTRVQREHDTSEDAAGYAAIDFSRYCLTPELVSRMKPYAPILHPFPRDQHFGEIPTTIDNDPRAMYFRQARNGMWARAALLAHVFDVDGQILRYFHNGFSG